MGDAGRPQVCLSRLTDGAGGRLWVAQLDSDCKFRLSTSSQPRPGSFGPRHVPAQARMAFPSEREDMSAWQEASEKEQPWTQGFLS